MAVLSRTTYDLFCLYLMTRLHWRRSRIRLLCVTDEETLRQRVVHVVVVAVIVVARHHWPAAVKFDLSLYHYHYFYLETTFPARHRSSLVQRLYTHQYDTPNHTPSTDSSSSASYRPAGGGCRIAVGDKWATTYLGTFNYHRRPKYRFNFQLVLILFTAVLQVLTVCIGH